MGVESVAAAAACAAGVAMATIISTPVADKFLGDGVEGSHVSLAVLIVDHNLAVVIALRLELRQKRFADLIERGGAPSSAPDRF